jgi:hypothetical protein
MGHINTATTPCDILKLPSASWTFPDNHLVGMFPCLASLGKSAPGTPWILATYFAKTSTKTNAFNRLQEDHVGGIV